MAVMARDSWTDERLDDLKGQMNQRFDRVEGDIEVLRSEMTQNFRTIYTILVGGFAAIVAAVIGAGAF